MVDKMKYMRKAAQLQIFYLQLPNPDEMCRFGGIYKAAVVT